MFDSLATDFPNVIAVKFTTQDSKEVKESTRLYKTKARKYYYEK